MTRLFLSIAYVCTAVVTVIAGVQITTTDDPLQCFFVLPGQMMFGYTQKTYNGLSLMECLNACLGGFLEGLVCRAAEYSLGIPVGGSKQQLSECILTSENAHRVGQDKLTNATGFTYYENLCIADYRDTDAWLGVYARVRGSANNIDGEMFFVQEVVGDSSHAVMTYGVLTGVPPGLPEHRLSLYSGSNIQLTQACINLTRGRMNSYVVQNETPLMVLARVMASEDNNQIAIVPSPVPNVTLTGTHAVVGSLIVLERFVTQIPLTNVHAPMTGQNTTVIVACGVLEQKGNYSLAVEEENLALTNALSVGALFRDSGCRTLALVMSIMAVRVWSLL